MNFGNIQGLVNGTEQVVFDYEVGGSYYPPAYSATYVKATNVNGAGYEAHLTCNPALSLTGLTANNQWLTGSGNTTNQRFHIDLGYSKVISRAYIVNSHNGGGGGDALTATGVKNFTLWGSNSATAFSTLTYGTDTDWTQLTTDISQLAEQDQTPADNQYVNITTSTAYRYYAFKFADNWGHASFMGVRRIELQVGNNYGAVSSISTGNILNGNEDGWYTIISMTPKASAGNHNIGFNGDTGTNYGMRGIGADATAIADFVDSTRSGIQISRGTSNGMDFNVSRVYAKSGAVRLVNGITAGNISGTTVTSCIPFGGVWSNTADNIVSIQLFSASAVLGVGTRMIVLKSNNFTNGTPTGSITTPYIKGAWVRVGSQILSSPASSVTFSGLDGDRQVCYVYSHMTKASSASTYGIMRPDNDSTTVYGRQSLRGTGTICDTLRAATLTSIQLDFSPGASGTFNSNQTILFAKQGFVRPAISQHSGFISGTTIDELRVTGHSYSVTNTNITSLVISNPSGNFDTGSQFDLYALYK